ncbi:MAG: 50S ribosomal protein L17 [Bacteroidales bacterium]|jgi:large subunit ribosomal protein L17|nr:50S ribosomal protein L17 [Bacteroidales bacterium]
MRHAKRINHLGRTATHRKAMLSNMASSLILHKRISTTLAKAKELRKYIEPLVTRSKNDTTHSRRTVFSYLQNKFAVTELFREIAQKVQGRPGGYTRILKTGFRQGDNAEMCIIEFVDYNETYTGEEKKKSTKTRRSSRKGTKAETSTVVPAKKTAETVTEPAETETAKAEQPAESEVIEPEVVEE